MQYVRSISGSVTKTWNSINPATLSGAIDVVVVEQDDGTLACSPFHVRFGKFSLLRPSEKKVEFKVNGTKKDFAMKLGEGGEAFFVFETSENIPESLQTSPLVSPASSPASGSSANLPEPSYLDINADSGKGKATESAHASSIPMIKNDAVSEQGVPPPGASSWPGEQSLLPGALERSASEEILSPSVKYLADYEAHNFMKLPPSAARSEVGDSISRPSSPPATLAANEAYERAISLSKKLSSSNIRAKVTETGDLMLDMTGYKSSEDDALRAEVIARKLLSDELEGNYDIGSLIGTDEHGNLWIYSSEEAKEAANRRTSPQALGPAETVATDAISDPGYHSDSDRATSENGTVLGHQRSRSEDIINTSDPLAEPSKSYAKTLRLTSDQLKQLELKPGPNVMSFTVNKATCQAYMYLWSCQVPIVISDIDGTITK